VKKIKTNQNRIATFSSNDDMLHEFRNRNLKILGWVSPPVLLPISAHNFYTGQYLLGVFMLFIMVIALLNAFATQRNSRLFVPLPIFFLLMFINIVLGLSLLGLNSLFWCYPVFVSVYFIMERTIARKLIIIGLVILFPYVYYLFGFELFVRFAITMCAMCYFNDVQIGTQLRIYKRVTQLIIRDPLTNAFNRRYMNTCIQNVIEESNRGLGPVSLLLIDIDHFKKINDKFGHDAGDQVLMKFVDVLHKRQRKIDYVFRTGGEEFVILLRNTELKKAVIFAENIRKHIEEAEWIDSHKVTISAGVSQYITDESKDDWLKRADDNMYQAKSMGRNKVFPEINSDE
jgi:diguanylate cyclase